MNLISHVYREGNLCADTLVNNSLDGRIRNSILHARPSFMDLQLMDDCNGALYPVLFLFRNLIAPLNKKTKKESWRA